MTFKKNVFRLSIMIAMAVASVNVLAVDFGVPADDNPLVPGIDAAVTLEELATGYTAAGDVFDITAPPNDAGVLNGTQYGPVAFGGVPGGATGWVNSSYTIPTAGSYALAFWVSDVGDTSVESALAFDNVQLPGSGAFTDFSSLPLGWETFGSGGFSEAMTGVSPTVGDNFAFIDTLNDGGFIDAEVIMEVGGAGGVDTSVFGGTVGSLVLSSAFSVTDHETTVSFDANFLSNDGDGFNDFAVVQLIDMDTLFVTAPDPFPTPAPILAEDLMDFAFEYLMASGIVEGTETDLAAFEGFLTGLAADVTVETAEDALDALAAEYGISIDDMIGYVGAVTGGELGGEFPSGGTTVVDYNFDTAVTLFTADSADPLIGLDAGIPVMPVVDPGTGVWVFPETPVVPDVTWWFDPEYAIGYDYTVSGSTFASIELPTATWGDNCYNLVVDGVVIHDCATSDGLMGGVPHDLTDLDTLSDPLTALTITGIEVDAALDPADLGAFNTGFQFATAGNIILTQAPITTPAPGVTHGTVPEPGTLLLMGAGILGFAGYRRKQVKTQEKA